MLFLSPRYLTGTLAVTESVGLPPYEGSIMQKSYFLPDNVSVHIHRPACPKCRAFIFYDARAHCACTCGFRLPHVRVPSVRPRSRCDGRHRSVRAIIYATGIGGSARNSKGHSSVQAAM